MTEPPPAKRAATFHQEDALPYVIEQVNERRARKFGVEEVTFRAKFNDDLQGRKLLDISDDLGAMFGSVMDRVRANHPNPQDKARLAIRHTGLDKEITIHCQPQHNITAEVIMQRFEAVLQSNKDLTVDDSFEVSVGVMSAADSGGGRVAIVNVDTLADDCTIKRKRSMVTIPEVPNEFVCAARAIVTCIAKVNKMPQAEFNNFVHKKSAMSRKQHSQRSQALKLHKDACVATDAPMPVHDLYKFEDCLNIQIIVVSGDVGDEIVYTGKTDRKRKIYLYLKDQHYHSIVNIKGFFVYKQFCEECVSTYSDKGRHSCESVCATCNTSKCFYGDDSVVCDSCNMVCRNTHCFMRHQTAREYQKGANKGDERLSLCDTYYRCLKCYKILDKTKRDVSKHICHEWYCFCCQEFVVGEHLCYYRIKKPKTTEGRFIYYDFETSQDQLITCDKGYLNRPKNGCQECVPEQMCVRCRRCVNCNRGYCGLERHVPNYLVCQTACDECKGDCFTPDAKCGNCGNRCSKCRSKGKDGFIKEPCPNDLCGKREMIFKGPDTCDAFCKWLITPQHKGCVAIAHNAKAFDSHFILNHCVNNGVFPEVVYSGSKIMTMTIKKGVDIRCIDSLNFLPMALKKLPAALGLSSELKKGDFPHFLNTKTFQNYVGPFPDPSYYGVQYMSKKDRESFMEWHGKQSSKVFNFQEEILAYTRSDVNILREACTKFRALLMDMTALGGKGVDPFAHATIASSAMQIVRELLLHEEHQVELLDGTKDRAIFKKGQWEINGEALDSEQIAERKFVRSPIPQIPARGYTKHPNDSHKAVAWLEWVAKVSMRKIQHSRNGGEFRIPGTSYHCDGYHADSKSVYEFLGCRWHGHTCLKDRHARDPRTGATLEKIHQRTLSRLKEISDKGYNVAHMWECQFDNMVKRNRELKEFVASMDLVTPLKIRESFFGGRVSPVSLFYEAAEGEQIKYYDVTSLYSYVNVMAEYPTCHPEIITEQAKMDYTLQSYYGLVKVKVAPPRKLFIPVLPVRCNGKLKFPLCSQCARLERVKPCQCSDAERAIVGTWTTEEVKVAIKHGYKIVKIYEIYHYPETTQDSNCSIFQDYVKMFLKVKQEASGYPSWVESEQDKDNYIKYYHEKQGILLDKAKILYNPSLRLVSKLYANTLWGKFIQRGDLPRTQYIKTKTEYTKIRNDPTKVITNFHIVTPEVIVVELKCAETFEEENTFTNEIIGTFTTSLARLHLFSILEKTWEKTLYFDTDSVIFVQNSGKEVLETGDLLGELTNELPSNTHIKTFLSTGPKSYSYKLNNGESVSKVKGITLNYVNSHIIDFDSMKDVVMDEIDKIKLPVSKQISRVKHLGIVYNRPYTKTFKKVFTKRVVAPDSFKTYPYGY